MRNELCPFVKKLKIDDCYYVYDVNSNDFFKVDEVVYSLIDRVDEQMNVIPLQHGENDPVNVFPPQVVEKAKIEIAKMMKLGYFSRHRPKITFFRGDLFLNILEETLESKLYRIILVLTEECNFRCKYCAYSGQYLYHRNHSKREMTPEIMRKAVDFYLAHSTQNPEKNLSFYGGEPLLNFRLLKECNEYIRKKCSAPVHYSMTTNAGLMTKEKIEFLVRNDFSLLVSLDGPEHINDRYRVQRNGEGSFNRVKENLMLMKSMYPEYYMKQVRFNIVLAPPYDFDAIRDFFNKEELIISSVGARFSTVNKRNTTFYDKFTKAERSDHYQSFASMKDIFYQKLSKGISSDAFEKYFFKKKFFGIHRREKTLLPDTYPSHGQCTLGQKGLFINADGTFNFCSQVEDVFNLGNVFDGYNMKSIKDIYYGLDDLFSSRCHGCWAIRICFKCIQDLNNNGTINNENFNKICADNRMTIEEEMINYLKIRESNHSAFDYLNNLKTS